LINAISLDRRRGERGRADATRWRILRRALSTGEIDMRRWLGGTMACALITALLAGCGNPAGVDGDLADDWSTLPEPSLYTPAANTCHSGLSLAFYRLHTTIDLYKPLDCGASHGGETVHIGQLAGADAAPSKPPTAGSPTVRKAHAECGAKATEFLGGDWRGARLQLWVMFPAVDGWSGGARWFRCDLSEIQSLDSPGNLVARTGSLRDALKSVSPIAYTCFNPVMTKGTSAVDTMTPVSCTAAHRAEFVGIWTAPDTPYADYLRNAARTHTGCRSVLAAYAKVPNDSNLPFRSGTIYYSPEPDAWANGDRGVRCFLWYDDKNLKRSMRNAGPSALPIR
jgi:hypothetical protein